MPKDEFTIGEAARQSGVKVPTIRYYEQIGLLPVASRSEGNRRLYDRPDLGRLAFIRPARGLGFAGGAIRTLLSLQDDPDQSCAAADAIAKARLVEVDKRIASLNALRDELKRMVKQCESGRIGDCRVIETLADTTHVHGRLAEA
ncbi:helix-turn-helix domain-containing protein [Mesorhizobium sp. GbtcB19]|uniref:MerR family transcriptional regulator n=1 Tax=Mesorhizobium sp. GbtcB19 TaxID=2824764 RepID=UPI001C311B21|nr:helix-turn-helix domain-containing protein [Mesorhizobium sp. GbtcB19]